MREKKMEIGNFRNNGCKTCVCYGCRDKDTRFCKSHCNKCDAADGKLKRKACLYTPNLD